MNIGIYIEANILSSLFCILLYFQQKRHKVFDFLGTTAFNSLLWATVTIMLVDIVSWFMIGNLIPHTDTHLLVVQTLYYLIQALLPLYFLLYCINTTGRRLKPIHHCVIYLPVLLTAVVLFFNFFDGFAFYIQDNSVFRGEGFLLAIFAPMLYLINALILCITFHFSNLDNDDKRRISFHMLICVSISMIGALICSVISFVSPWHVFIASLIYLYMQLHGYRERSLDILAYTDSLTGVKNHAAYSHIREKMENKLLRDPHCSFAVAVMDINNLKKTNDAYGHKAGDALIIGATRLLCTIFHHSPVCRIGGDEFVAILENSDYENRDELQRKFMEQMKVTTFFAGNKEHPLTAALGIAVYRPEYHTSFAEVFQEADTAMYENKAQLKACSDTK